MANKKGGGIDDRTRRILFQRKLMFALFGPGRFMDLFELGPSPDTEDFFGEEGPPMAWDYLPEIEFPEATTYDPTGPFDPRSGLIGSVIRTAERAAELESASLPLASARAAAAASSSGGARRQVVYMEGIGFRTLSVGSCVDYDLARSLDYHRPEFPQNFGEGPQGPDLVAPVQGFSCPDPGASYGLGQAPIEWQQE